MNHDASSQRFEFFSAQRCKWMASHCTLILSEAKNLKKSVCSSSIFQYQIIHNVRLVNVCLSRVLYGQMIDSKGVAIENDCAFL